MGIHKNHILVAGAGILGLAVARQILLRRPGVKITVLEKEPDVARHQSGHNSGVLHSGIYYAPGSEKARFCAEGAALMRRYCEERAIPTKHCGKVIVAVSESEIPSLKKLLEWGQANRVGEVRLIDAGRLREIEPAVRGLCALHLPDAAVVDFATVVQHLKKDIELGGAQVVLHRKVTGVRDENGEVTVETDRGAVSGHYFVNCAGLYCDRIAEASGVRPDLQIVPFRGQYYRLKPDWAKRIRGLVYPAPNAKLPFLGIHLTPDLQGRVLVGPNAVLAFAREGYRAADIYIPEMLRYLAYGGFWKMAARHWRFAVKEWMQTVWPILYLREVRKYLPGLSLADWEAGGAGVRAQAVDGGGQLLHDFAFGQQPHALHLLNAPSPAATSSLAIAGHLETLIPNLS